MFAIATMATLDAWPISCNAGNILNSRERIPGNYHPDSVPTF